ncbi:precorrin-6y C5,15-methyltransferase (decarboxylating) subunit CbiE [Serpentinicella alkaliphila]|uniref:Precorrin-6Y C5,15-methyltransferase (Decarboxylating) n=1 Tax=Serpentinicella alkaliphila TaxID=1734049 RepID=A0A4R2TN87_9FIRM|nr:precorrin-6y C5,15-methyltransferase (decarboxylating) subunit CbiE [Serpentinicella alkaliphila]QUH27110.1 precorrin-6y C5,15-methyltransferase (decarboxylating) subunit CbiE [Serpentinicella alkaliphila]TCQ05240.1 precorrin-6Y C5,15-methyltransferase (decarboxylating) [Serpentinicella alkaliphila]
MNSITIVGIGPGALELVTPIALKAIEDCDLIVAGKRNLKTFEHLGKEVLEFDSGIKDMIEKVEYLRTFKKVCIAVSGDPGFYSFLDAFISKFDESELTVIPGISSFQYLFSKLKKSWKNFELLSLHGRIFDDIDFNKREGVLFLTDKKNTPSVIATNLLENGYCNMRMIIGENLSYDDERITISSPETIKSMEFSDLCVVVIER